MKTSGMWLAGDLSPFDEGQSRPFSIVHSSIKRIGYWRRWWPQLSHPIRINETNQLGMNKWSLQGHEVSDGVLNFGVRMRWNEWWRCNGSCVGCFVQTEEKETKKKKKKEKRLQTKYNLAKKHTETFWLLGNVAIFNDFIRWVRSLCFQLNQWMPPIPPSPLPCL